MIDLSSIATGTVVSLSFELIGFGRNKAVANSQITLRDQKLGAPQTVFDLVTTVESSVFNINALAVDLDQPDFSSILANFSQWSR